MKPITFFNKKYALLVSILFTTIVSSFSTDLGCTTGIIDATQPATNFSDKAYDSSYKWNDSSSILSSIFLNTWAIIQATEKTSSEDIHGFKDGSHLIELNNEQFVHFIGSTNP